MGRHLLGWCAWAVLAALAAACGDDGGGGSGDAGPDADADTDADADADTDADTDADGGADGGEACADSAEGTFPGEAVEIAYAEGEASATIADYDWTPIEGSYGTYTIGVEPMWEAVRYDILAPATIYGARVQWGNLLGDGEITARLGAYADFGSNGFDFWQWEALWEGDRCLQAGDAGAWIDYVFDEPIELDQPGLFYIAHFFEGPSDPAFLFETVENDCAPYAGCHSAINMPGADDEAYYNGMTFQFPYDYGVRLLVELHDDIPAEDKWFQPSGALTASSRVAWGDYDNDGWLDYFGQGTGMTAPDILVRNDGDGTFTDVTADCLINDLQDIVDCDAMDPEHSPTEGSAWVDLDNDGYLDLYLAEYECGASYTNYRDRIWHNEGDGTFTDWTAAGHGFSLSRQAGRGVSPADYDQDGDVDIFVSNYRLDPNFFYVNQGDGTFDEQESESHLVGVGGAENAFGHTIGAAWLDAENDGDFDILLSNLAHPRFYQFSDRTQLMINDGAGIFTDAAAAAGIHYRETHSNPTVADFDGDGWQDFFVTCVYEGRFSEMYFSRGDGTFDQVNYESGAVAYNGWGSAASDYDNDGDVDLVAYTLFDNVSAAAGNNWLQVRTLGGMSDAGMVNAAGVGAVVTVTVDGAPRLGHTSGGSGTGCQDSAYLVFGLGAAETVDSIEVLYPGGAVVTVDGPIAANQRVWIAADGGVSYGWDYPI